jgi:hypothetical protein
MKPLLFTAYLLIALPIVSFSGENPKGSGSPSQPAQSSSGQPKDLFKGLRIEKATPQPNRDALLSEHFPDSNYPVSMAGASRLQKAQASLGILDWSRMTRKEFSCLMEKTFGHKDKEFPCKTKQNLPIGDPCKNTKWYSAGPSLPTELGKKIHPLINQIRFEWEHGDMRSFTVAFTDRVSPRLIAHIFNLPLETNYPPTHKNVMSISIQDCHKDHNCLVVQGFDHMGAGDVDCSTIH